MHFYRYNIGDYRKDTGHLSLVEHGIYRALLDTYYTEEHPLCADDAKLMRTHGIRTQDEKDAYQNVINDFFFKTERGYEHDRCNTELGLIYEKSDKARVSAEKRWGRNKQKNSIKSVGENADSMRTHSERNANASKSDANDMLPSNLVTQLPSNTVTDKQTTPRNARTPTALKMLLDARISEQVANDFLVIRKAKRAPLTETALAGIKREADKAGWPLENALKECVIRGWVGFSAEWVNKPQTMTAGKPSYDDGQKRDYTQGAGLL